jgi:hypothetical protein
MLFGFLLSQRRIGEPSGLSPVQRLKIFWGAQAQAVHGGHTLGGYRCRCATCAQTFTPQLRGGPRASQRNPRVALFVIAACAIAPLLVASAAYAWMGRLAAAAAGPVPNAAAKSVTLPVAPAAGATQPSLISPPPDGEAGAREVSNASPLTEPPATSVRGAVAADR